MLEPLYLPLLLCFVKLVFIHFTEVVVPVDCPGNTFIAGIICGDVFFFIDEIMLKIALYSFPIYLELLSIPMKEEVPVEANGMNLILEGDSAEAIEDIILELAFDDKTLLLIEVANTIGSAYLVKFNLSS